MKVYQPFCSLKFTFAHNRLEIHLYPILLSNYVEYWFYLLDYKFWKFIMHTFISN